MAAQGDADSNELTNPQPRGTASTACPPPCGVDSTQGVEDDGKEACDFKTAVNAVDSVVCPQEPKVDGTYGSNDTETESSYRKIEANAADSTLKTRPRVSVFGTVELLEKIRLAVDPADPARDEDGEIIVDASYAP